VVDLDWSPAQKYAGLFLFEAVFWGLVLSLGFWLGFPGNGLFIGVIAVLNIIIGLAGFMITSEGGEFSGFKTKPKQQLSNIDAKELAWFYIRKYEGYRVKTVIGEGDVPEKGDFEDKEDARRLFKFEFRPLNVSGKACLYLALDQDLSVNIEDTESLKEAAEEIRSTRMVRSWQVPNYEERKKNAREKLGMTSTPEVLLSTGEGDTENVQVVTPQQLPSRGESSDED